MEDINKFVAIGHTFEHRDGEFVVVESEFKEDTCLGCHFYGLNWCSYRYCKSMTREDGKNIVFKEVV